MPSHKVLITHKRTTRAGNTVNAATASGNNDRLTSCIKYTITPEFFIFDHQRIFHRYSQS
ncbi:MAG: hypothetical protein R3E73_10495 [Porticoccaceae bacterium]|nr:hypothetical protein [Pseudomonadales bacterium]MCP5171076.1 hypothetical protein [Pseudomonadales bacterium]MCP5301685.1 hypothetical protein [Pseudomonadales bacterium]